MIKKEEHPIIEKKKHLARKASIQEGIYASGRVSLGDRYISPFAVAINASSSLISILSSLAGLLGPLSQIFGSKLIKKYPRKKIVLKGVLLESLTWIPLIIIAILFQKNILTEMLPIFLLISFSFFIISANIIHPAWFSWMGDLISPKKRGNYYSKRGLIIGVVAIILAIISSIFLDYFKKSNLTMYGFIILFSLSLLSRLKCWKIFHKQYEPKIKIRKKDNFSFVSFLIECPKTNFGRFTIYRFLLSLGGYIYVPLVTVYLLKNLNFSYSTYMVIIMSEIAFSLILIKLWGKIIDRYGSYSALAISSILIPIVPFLWILSPSPIYLIFVPVLLSGIAWSGFNLGGRAFIYDNVSSKKIGLVISYYDMVNGLGIFFGSLIGAFLIKFLNTSFLEPILVLFLIGGTIRALSAIWWIPEIKEIKHKEKFKGTESLKNMILKQTKPTLIEEAHEIVAIPKYLREE